LTSIAATAGAPPSGKGLKLDVRPVAAFLKKPPVAVGAAGLLLMAAVGYWLYGETPGLATIVGSVLIVGAALYTLHRNAVRQSPIPPDPRPD
jgi:drug/metabolite transporter (DMT)-like permease